MKQYDIKIADKGAVNYDKQIEIYRKAGLLKGDGEMNIDEHLNFEDDKLYHYYPLPQYGEGICKKDLVMTKEIFIECYKRWIKGSEVEQ